MEYTFNIKNKFCANGITFSLCRFIKEPPPVIVCIGTDGVIGDSLGPLCGSMLKKRALPCVIYGCLDMPITALEANFIAEFVKKTHPYSPIVAIDSAVGNREDISNIKVFEGGIKPGLGANKNLSAIGDVSVIGIVSERSKNNAKLFNDTRLRTIYLMAEQITSAICAMFETAVGSG